MIFVFFFSDKSYLLHTITNIKKFSFLLYFNIKVFKIINCVPKNTYDTMLYKVWFTNCADNIKYCPSDTFYLCLVGSGASFNTCILTFIFVTGIQISLFHAFDLWSLSAKLLNIIDFQVLFYIHSVNQFDLLHTLSLSLPPPPLSISPFHFSSIHIIFLKTQWCWMGFFYILYSFSFISPNIAASRRLYAVPSAPFVFIAISVK